MHRALWIGGPPGSGKSTVADRLARRHGLRLYSADTRTWAHRDRAVAAGVQAAIRWEALPPAERATVPTEEMLAMWLHAERGPMVVADVAALPSEPLVLAEGTTVPAALVPRDRSIWLLPTTQVQRRRMEERRLPPAVQALYALLAARIGDEAAEARVAVLEVDASLGIDDVVDRVEHHFAQFLPKAGTSMLVQRRALLREANLAEVGQVRGYYTRAWAVGTADDVERSFACECGETSCTARITTTVGVAAAGRLVEHDHELAGGAVL